MDAEEVRIRGEPAFIGLMPGREEDVEDLG